MSEKPAPPPLGAPSLLALFLGFFSVGMCAFGGVLPWGRRMIVEQRRWLTPSEFSELLGVCQFIPGPNMVNVAVALGARWHGVAGAAAAFVGLWAAPFTVVLCLATIYDRFGSLPVVQNAFSGLAAAASALILATALKIAAPLRQWPIGIAIAALVVCAVAILRWPLPAVLAATAPISIALAHWSRR